MLAAPRLSPPKFSTPPTAICPTPLPPHGRQTPPPASRDQPDPRIGRKHDPHILATTCPRLGASRLGQPVFATQSVDAAEFAEVRCHHYQTAAARVPSDQQVIGADHLAAALQHYSDFRRMRSSVDVERQNLEPGGEALDLLSVLD